MDLEATYERGFELRCNGLYSEAKVEFQKVLSVDPSHLKARHQIGLIQGFEGDFDASLATLQGVTAENPGNTEFLYDLAMTQMMLGESELACENFSKILAIEPNHEKAKQQIIYC